MFHLVARTRHRRLAFSSWVEGVRLWNTVTAMPGVHAVCVMPDHVHLVTTEDVRPRLGIALGGYARWRNSQRGETGAVWERLPASQLLADPQKVRRSIRYVHLNPCRAGLVGDPIAWPLSTHLDALGLVEHPVRRRAHDTAQFHAYVSGDPTVAPEGSDLLTVRRDHLDPSEVLHAVTVVARAPRQAWSRPGAVRTLAIRAVRTLTPASARSTAALLGIGTATVLRVRPSATQAVRLAELWASDRRCTPLDDDVLHHLLSSSRYRWAAR